MYSSILSSKRIYRLIGAFVWGSSLCCSCITFLPPKKVSLNHVLLILSLEVKVSVKKKLTKKSTKCYLGNCIVAYSR